jgi:hypothetical protein
MNDNDGSCSHRYYLYRDIGMPISAGYKFRL